ncbi:MAG: T9SS type A sorting domain-containing protein [Cryomorphaceae bacterium]
MIRILLTASISLAIGSAAFPQTGWDYFDANNIEAIISPVANHFWDYSDNHYFIPKDSGTTSIFTSTLWIGGVDSTGLLHLAAERFRQSGKDYLPGPYSSTDDYHFTTTSPWDRVWVINKQEVEDWLDNPFSNPVPQSVLDWPAHGDASLGQASNLVPFVDMNGDGNYDPVNDFDYPAFKGDQTVLFLFNDDGLLHTESGGQQLGVEIWGMAYGFNCPEDEALHNTLFMEYHITNRSDMDYFDCAVGLWNDFDLGNAQDDYIASDVTRNLFYVYNGDDEDQDANGKTGYHFNLPAQGVRILSGIQMDDDDLDNQPSVDTLGNYYGFGMDDGIIDNERLGLAHFTMHNNSAGPTGDPSNATEYDRFMNGYWKDGTPITYGGTGYDPNDSTVIRARCMFADSGDSVHYNTYGTVPSGGPIWTEAAAGNTPGDRRGVGSMGPFDLSAGEEVDFTIAYVFAQKPYDRLGAVTKMKAASDHIQELFDTQITECGPFDPGLTVGVEDAASSQLALYPNPAGAFATVTGLATQASYLIIDMKGATVASGKLSAGRAVIDLSALPSGVFVVQVMQEDTTDQIRLIKQ